MNFTEIVHALQDRLEAEFPVLDEDDVDAIIGNSAWECGRFKQLQERKPLVKGSRGGYGFMQWTGPRRRQYEAWCAARKLDPTSFEANAGFLVHELKNTPEKRVLARMQAVEGLPFKTRVFMETFLRPGIPHLESRIRYAQECRELRARRAKRPPPATTLPGRASSPPASLPEVKKTVTPPPAATLGFLAWLRGLFGSR